MGLLCSAFTVGAVQAQITQDLVLHLPFDNNLTNAGSGAGITPTAPNGVEAYVAGQVGAGALSLPGDGTGYVSLGDPSDLSFGTSTDFTYAFWIRLTGDLSNLPSNPYVTRTPILNRSDDDDGSRADGGWTAQIIVDGQGRPNETQYEFHWHGENEGRASQYVKESEYGDLLGNFASTDEWTHIAVVTDRDTAGAIFINGVLTDVETNTTRLSGNLEVSDEGVRRPLNIGVAGDPITLPPFIGEIDDLAIWRRALTEAEVKTVFGSGRNNIAVSDITTGIPGLSTVSNVDMGVQAQSFFTAARTFTIENIGSEPLTVGNFVLTGTDAAEFSTSIVSGSSPLNTGETLTVEISWDPTIGGTVATPPEGERTATLTFDHNDPSNFPSPTTKDVAIVANVIPTIETDLVAYFPFDGNLTDASTDPVTNVITWNDDVSLWTDGRTVTPLTFVPGAVGQALDFPGNPQDYAVLADDTNLQFGASTDFSLSLWFNPTDNGGTVNSDTIHNRFPAMLTNKNFRTDSNPGWGVQFRRDNPKFGVADGAASIANDPGSDIPVDQWAHIGLVCDRDGNVSFFVNGTLLQSSDMSAIGDMDQSRDFLLGQDWGLFEQTAEHLNDLSRVLFGEMDEVAIWRRALTPTEMALIYNEGLEGNPVTSVAPAPAPVVVADADWTNAAPFYLTSETPTPEVLTLTVTNNGLLPVDVNVPTLSGADIGEFTIGGIASTTQLNPSESLPITVTWNADLGQLGERDATLTLSYATGGFGDEVFDLNPGVYTVQASDLLNNLQVHLQFEGNLIDTAPDGTNNSASWNNDTTAWGDGRTVTPLTFVPGAVGQALDFPGNPQDYAFIEDAPNLQFGTSTDFSLSLWFNPTDNGGTVNADTVHNRFSALFGNKNFRSDANPGWGMQFRRDNPKYAVNSIANDPGSDIPVDQWAHLVLTVDRDGLLSFYVNNVLLEQRDVSTVGTVDQGRGFFLGQDWGLIEEPGSHLTDLSRVLFGEMDDLALWNRLIEPWEVQFIYELGLSGNTFGSGTTGVGEEAWMLYH